VKVEVTGATLRRALEHGVASVGVEAQPGRFPQVSGIRFSFDASRKPGDRVTNILVNGKPLDDRKFYSLAATNYVVKDAGDGYDMFREAKVLIGPERAPSESDILQKKIGSVASIAPKTDGRITRVDTPKDQKKCD
jgi:5'-nucleotidase